MDSVRLGRVLGRGARGAAKTLLSAADAASAPNPRPSPNPPPPGSRPAPDPRPAAPARSAAPPSAATGSAPLRRATAGPASAAIRPTATNLAEGSRRLGTAVTAPIRRFSGVLWLEFTGFFFGLFALSAALGAWRLRAALHAAPGDLDRTHFFLAVPIAVVFAYFCFTSFARAARRGRQP